MCKIDNYEYPYFHMYVREARRISLTSSDMLSMFLQNRSEMRYIFDLGQLNFLYNDRSLEGN